MVQKPGAGLELQLLRRRTDSYTFRRPVREGNLSVQVFLVLLKITLLMRGDTITMRSFGGRKMKMYWCQQTMPFPAPNHAPISQPTRTSFTK